MADHFTKDEIQQLRAASDARGMLSLFTSWSLIVAAAAAVAVWPHPAMVIAAIIVIGGRQLGLVVLMHEASHRSLFRTRWLNDVVGRWLCGAPMWTRIDTYREHHMKHHAYTNTNRDPDLALVAPFPVSRRSLARKLLRDVTGLTGLKRIFGLTLMSLGLLRYSPFGVLERAPRPTLGRMLKNGLVGMGPMLLTNAVLVSVAWAVGQTWLYALWAVAYLTVFSLVLRVRSLAEHACTAPVDSEEARNPLRNTRTTRAGWLARLILAPHHVNYHLEHHLLMTVPHYRLPQMRRMLKERGAVSADMPTYWDVLRLVSSKSRRNRAAFST